MQQGSAALLEDPSNGGSTIQAAREHEERALTDTGGYGKYPDGPPMTKLGDDEPWFFLRAQDERARWPWTTTPTCSNAVGDHKGAMPRSARSSRPCTSGRSRTPHRVKHPD
jgi:hypothetical protein